MAILALKQTVDFYRNQNTPVYICFVDAKRAFDRVNNWTVAKKLLDRNMQLHIVKLFIFWYKEQEFIVRWSNSLSMTFRYSNGIRKGGQLSPLLYSVYTDDLNHLLRATGVGYCVGGAWGNSLSYAVDMVLVAHTVAAFQTLMEECRAYAEPHDIVYNTKKTVCMLVRPKQSQGRYSTRVRLGDEELSFVDEFRYLGHMMTAGCRDDKVVVKQFRRKNAVYYLLVRKFSFAPMEAKIQLFRYCYPIYGCALWSHSYQNSIRKLTVSYSDTSNDLLMSPDTPARVRHLR